MERRFSLSGIGCNHSNPLGLELRGADDFLGEVGLEHFQHALKIGTVIFRNTRHIRLHFFQRVSPPAIREALRILNLAGCSFRLGLEISLDLLRQAHSFHWR